MDVSRQIRDLRKRDDLSQEDLAERIYVSRQTISNWETERSYPDLQSLLLLSILFDVSLDELVKGDVETMKNELDVYKLNVWGWVMLAGLIAGIIIAFPLFKVFGLVGLIPSGVLLVAGLVAAIALERLKKKNNVNTYAEVLSFMEGGHLDREKDTWEKNHKVLAIALKLIGGAVAGLVLAFLSMLIASLF